MDKAQIEKALRNADRVGDEVAARKLARALSALPDGYDLVGSYGDGVIYRNPNGEMGFKSPEYATSDPREIQNMLDGRRPYRDEIGAVEGVARAGLQGASMGFGDEIAAGGAAALTGDQGGTFNERYQQFRGRERDKVAQFQEERPVLSVGSELGGAVGTGVGLAGAGLTTFRSGMPLSRAMLAGAGEGAGYGAVSGAGYSEADDRWDILRDVRDPGLAGAGVGAAAPLFSRGGSALARFFRDRVASHVGTPTSQANARVAAALRQSGQTPEQVSEALRNMGNEGAIMDVMGDPGRALARSAANVSPVARETLENMSRGRIAGQPDRISDTLLSSVGLDGPKTVQELQQAARDKAMPAINAAYDEARSLGFDIDLESFSDLMQSDMARKAFAKAVNLARNRQIAEAASGGTVGRHNIENGPSNLAILDEFKKTLDANGMPGLGKRPTNEQAIAQKLSAAVRDRIDGNLPEYGGARESARKLFQQEKAIAMGAKGAGPRAPADFRRYMEELSEELQSDAASGFVSEKVNQVETRRATPGTIDALFGSKRQQEALQAALGDGAAPVIRQIANERAFAATDRALRGNSTTARQLAEMGITGAGGAGLGLVYGGDAESAGVGALAGMLAQRGGGTAVRAMTRRKEAQVGPILADILTGKDIPKAATKQIRESPALQALLTRLAAQQAAAATVAP